MHPRMHPRLLHQAPTQVIRNRQIRVYLALESPSKQHRPLLRSELLDARLDLGPEMAHETLDWPCGGVAEGADCAAFDLFAVNE